MNQTGDRIPCPKCQASNFASSAVCWQCGEPLPGAQVQAGETPSEPTPPGPTPPQPPPYGPPPPMPPMPAMPTSDNTQTLVILGFVFAALGIICCPIFPIVGIIFGVIVQRRGNQLGTWIIVANVLALVASLAFSAMIAAKYMELLKHGGIPNPYNNPVTK